MLNKVRAAINDHAMLQKGRDITVALSGGADSMALLYALIELSDEFNLKISAAHLNHNLRGAESKRDADFVQQQCRYFGVKLVSHTADVLGYAEKNHLGTELAAREIRYAFLAQNSSGLIATAHTASDNLETVIMNLTRGTGIKGLCGIPPVRDNFIRPLIYVTRQEVEDYCAQKQIPFVTDSSNLTDDYTRNIIRHRIVPVLKNINPAVEATVTHSAHLFREDERFLSDTAHICFSQAFKDNSLCTADFAELPEAIASRVLRLFCDAISIKDTDNGHIKTLYNIALKNSGKAVMPGKITVECENNTLRIEEPKRDNRLKFKVKITKTDISTTENQEKVNNLLLKNAIDCDKIVGDIKIRTRLPGDEISLCARGVTKSLKKLFNEEKIPMQLRDIIPVISDAAGVIWVYGFGASRRVAVTKQTKNIYIVDTIKDQGDK